MSVLLAVPLVAGVRGWVQAHLEVVSQAAPSSLSCMSHLMVIGKG